MNVRQVEWQGKPAVAIGYVSDKQQMINITMFVILGASLGLSLALVKVHGLIALIPVPIAAIITADALRQRMFILMDAKRRFLTGIVKGFIFTKELYTIQVIHINEIILEDSTVGQTELSGYFTVGSGRTRRFLVIAKGRTGNFLISYSTSERNSTLIAYAVSRALGKQLGGRVNLAHWKDYIEVLEAEEKEVLGSLISDRGRALD